MASEQRSNEPPKRGRVLVVDDEDGIRVAVRRIMRGYEVVEAASGAEARSILERDQAFDVLLCDVVMPNTGGIELHQWLCDVYPHLAKRLVFLTGGTFTLQAREYLKRVENVKLEKPFEIGDLRVLLSERIRLTRNSQET